MAVVIAMDTDVIAAAVFFIVVSFVEVATVVVDVPAHHHTQCSGKRLAKHTWPEKGCNSMHPCTQANQLNLKSKLLMRENGVFRH